MISCLVGHKSKRDIAPKHQSIETPKHIIPELERERDRRGPEQISPEAYITKSVHHRGERDKPNHSNTKAPEQRDQIIETPKHQDKETISEQHQSTRIERSKHSNTKASGQRDHIRVTPESENKEIIAENTKSISHQKHGTPKAWNAKSMERQKHKSPKA